MRDVAISEFLKEIQKNSPIYDYTNPNYNNRIAIEKIWTQIGEMFEESAFECKSKWRIIRSSFIRSLNYKCRQGKEKKSEYYLSQHLQFLLPFIRIGKSDNDPLGESSRNNLDGYLENSRDGQESFEDIISEEDHQENAQKESESFLRVADDNYPQTEIEEQEYQPVSKRRRYTPSNQTSDHCEMFLLSLAPHMRALPLSTQLSFQRKVLKLLEDVAYSKVKAENNTDHFE